MLCWSDGRTQFMLDFSLHGEKGKIEGKEQGLTSEQRNRRYERKRDKKCQLVLNPEREYMEVFNDSAVNTSLVLLLPYSVLHL